MTVAIRAVGDKPNPDGRGIRRKRREEGCRDECKCRQNEYEAVRAHREKQCKVPSEISASVQESQRGGAGLSDTGASAKTNFISSPSSSGVSPGCCYRGSGLTEKGDSAGSGLFQHPPCAAVCRAWACHGLAQVGMMLFLRKLYGLKSFAHSAERQ